MVNWTIVNKETKEIFNGTGVANIIKALAAGNYTITIQNAETENIAGCIASCDFTFNKAPSTVNVSDITFVYGESGNTTVSYSGATNVTSVIVDHSEAVVKVENGFITVSNLDAGNYTMNVTTVPDGNHTAVSKVVNVTVTQASAEMNVTSDIVEAGENSTITVNLPKDATCNVTVTLPNGTNYTGEVKNGVANVEVPGLPMGDTNVTVTYSGDKNYSSNSTNLTVHVNGTSIDASDMKRGWDSPYDYQAKIIDEKGNPVKDQKVIFTVDGKQYNATTDDNCVVKLTSSKLAVGTYNVTVTVPMCDANATAKITIVKRLLENKDFTKDYESSKQYKVRAIGDDGNPIGKNVIVQISTNGKTYKIKTDKNGYATLSIHLKPKKYTVTSKYHGTTVKNKLTVKWTLFLVKKTVKVKKGKKIVLKAKLKWSSGKPIKGKKITFKFKGKKYKAKTNKKGIAKVTIKNKKVLKKLKKGKKYTYSAKYIKEVRKGKVKIKK